MSAPRGVAGAVAAALALALSLGAGPAARASTSSTTTAPSARLTLAAQPAWSPVGAVVPLHLHVDGDATGLEVRAVVHSAVTSRTGFARTLAGQGLGGELATVRATMASLPVDAGGRVLSLALQDPSLPRDPNRLAIAPGRGAGEAVFPVDIELRDPARGNRVDGFVTHLVVAATTLQGTLTAGQPVDVAWVWRIAGPAAMAPDGKLQVATLAALMPDGRLGTMATALTGAPDIPVTLAPGPETLAAWAQPTRQPAVSAGLDAVRNAAGTATNQVLAGTYVPIDGRALEAAGLGGELPAELAQGTDTLDDVLRAQIDPRTALADPLDGSALERLREAGVFRVVVDPAALAPLSTKFTPAQPFALKSQGRTFTAAASDPELGALLTGSGVPALQAQHFLADLAVIAGEQPNQSRGVVAMTPTSWAPNADLLTAVLTGLRGNPLARPVRLDVVLDDVPPLGGHDKPTVREVVGSPPGSPVAVSARALHDAQDRLDAFAALVGGDDPRVARERRTLLTPLSSTFSGASGHRRAAEYLASIDRTIATFVRGVHTPGDRSITLTARRAAIPVSVQNETGRVLRVRVALVSDKLAFPNGSSKILELQPHNTTATFTVETRTSGTFPLTIAVTSADGRIAFAPARVTVHSTVFSNVGLLLTVGAGLFLAVWWLAHARRRRRARARGVHATGRATRELAPGSTSST